MEHRSAQSSCGAPRSYASSALKALVSDYDGTLTASRRPDEGVLDVLGPLRAHGVRVVIASGQILEELLGVFRDALQHVDAIVYEDGAALTTASESQLLAEPVPDDLDQALTAHGVSFRRGEVLLAMRSDAAEVALDAVREFGLDTQLVVDRNERMLLPAATTKGTGTRTALAAMDRSPHNAVARGDAENRPDLLAPGLMDSVTAAVRLGSAGVSGPPVRRLAAVTRVDPTHLTRQLVDVPAGKAVVVRRGWPIAHVQVSARTTPHARHWHKYVVHGCPHPFHLRLSADELLGRPAATIALHAALLDCPVGVITHQDTSRSLRHELADDPRHRGGGSALHLRRTRPRTGSSADLRRHQSARPLVMVQPCGREPEAAEVSRQASQEWRARVAIAVKEPT